MTCASLDCTGGGEPPTATSLVSEAMAIFAKKTENALPCSRLALTAHDFSDLVSGRGSIASFLCANLKPQAATIVSSRSGGGGGGASSPAGAVVIAGDVGDEKGVLSRGRTEKAIDPQDVRLAKSEPRSSTSSGGGSNCSSSSMEGNNSTPAAEDETRDPREEVCPKCGETLAAEEDLQEHLDFHYAEGLQARYSREGDVARDMAARMSGPGGLPKRRREGNTGKGGKQGKVRGREGRRIDSFFKPA